MTFGKSCVATGHTFCQMFNWYVLSLQLLQYHLSLFTSKHRDTEKRQVVLTRSKITEKEDIKPSTSPEMDKSKGDNYNKKTDSEIPLIASLPKPQSLPAHQLFKDKRKVYQVTCAVMLDSLGFLMLLTKQQQHTGCFTRVMVTDQGMIV